EGTRGGAARQRQALLLRRRRGLAGRTARAGREAGAGADPAHHERRPEAGGESAGLQQAGDRRGARRGDWAWSPRRIRLRPGDRDRKRLLRRVVRQARAGRRRRRLLSIAPPHRHAEGQGDGVLRRKAFSRGSIHAGSGEPGGQRRRLRRHGRRLTKPPARRADLSDRIHQTAAQRLPRHRPFRCVRCGGHGAGDPVVFARLHGRRAGVRGEASHRVHRVVEMARLQERVDIPTIDAASAPYWEAARRGQLLIAECAACGRVHHYPRPFCPHCWSEDVHPVQASGSGTLYTYSTVYVNDLAPFKERLPYVAAIVELAEGPRLMTTIEGGGPDDLLVGMPVTAVFRPVDDADPDSPYLTVFTPSEESP